MSAVERVYTINLGKVLLSPDNRRAMRAIHMIQEFARKHMKTSDVRIDQEVSHQVWARGIRSPPRRIRVRMAKTDEGHVLISKYDGAPSATVQEPVPEAPAGPSAEPAAGGAPGLPDDAPSAAPDAEPAAKGPKPDAAKPEKKPDDAPSAAPDAEPAAKGPKPDAAKPEKKPDAATKLAAAKTAEKKPADKEPAKKAESKPAAKKES